MMLVRLHVEGLKGANGVEVRPEGRLATFPPGAAGVAFADGLELLAAALDPAGAPARLCALDLCDASEALVEEEALSQVTLSGSRIGALLHRDGDRRVAIELDLLPDPPLFGALRRSAARDPRLVTALGGDANVRVRVGWLFTGDLGVGSPTVFEVRVGDASFPGMGKERPAWVPSFLRDVGRRILRVAPRATAVETGARLFEASVAADPAVRRGYWRAAKALAAPPFSLGRLGFVRRREAFEPVFGDELLRARQLGPAADEALRLAAAVYVDAPDVLVVEAPGAALPDPEAVRRWLLERCEGEGATLEQVIVVPGGAS